MKILQSVAIFCFLGIPRCRAMKRLSRAMKAKISELESLKIPEIEKHMLGIKGLSVDDVAILINGAKKYEGLSFAHMVHQCATDEKNRKGRYHLHGIIKSIARKYRNNLRTDFTDNEGGRITEDEIKSILADPERCLLDVLMKQEDSQKWRLFTILCICTTEKRRGLWKYLGLIWTQNAERLEELVNFFEKRCPEDCDRVNFVKTLKDYGIACFTGLAEYLESTKKDGRLKRAMGDPALILYLRHHITPEELFEYIEKPDGILDIALLSRLVVEYRDIENPDEFPNIDVLDDLVLRYPGFIHFLNGNQNEQ